MNALAHAFPTEVPIPHHRSRNFVSLPRLGAVQPEIDQDRIKIVSKSRVLARYLLSGLQALDTDLVGVMQGEYALTPDGLLLMNSSGVWFSINYPFDTDLAANNPKDKVNTDWLRTLREKIIDNWDRYPVVESPLPMSTVWNNYYHYTFDFVTKLRLAEPFGVKQVIIPEELFQRRYQVSLLQRALGSREIVLADVMRVRNPIIAECVQSRASLTWLRETMKIDAPPGRKRYFVRRTQARMRIGNNLAPTPELLALLQRYGFEIVDFGSGELTVEEQVAQLSEAEIVLSPHGAGLTNLAYLNPPLTVIEVFSYGLIFSGFLQIAMQLGFRYYGVLEQRVDAVGDVVVDVEELDRILRECLG